MLDLARKIIAMQQRLNERELVPPVEPAVAPKRLAKIERPAMPCGRRGAVPQGMFVGLAVPRKFRLGPVAQRQSARLISARGRLV